MSQTAKRDEAAFYEIRVQGVLDESWSEWLGGLDIRPLDSGETVLTGHDPRPVGPARPAEQDP